MQAMVFDEFGFAGCVRHVGDVRRTRCGPARRVQLVRRARKLDEIFRVMVAAQVVSKPPDDDGGMVRVALDHFAELLLVVVINWTWEAFGVNVLGVIGWW